MGGRRLGAVVFRFAGDIRHGYVFSSSVEHVGASPADYILTAYQRPALAGTRGCRGDDRVRAPPRRLSASSWLHVIEPHREGMWGRRNTTCSEDGGFRQVIRRALDSPDRSLKASPPFRIARTATGERSS